MFNLNLPSHLLVLMFSGFLVTLSACSSDGETRPDYLDATTIKGLEIPPKLTQPDTRGAMRLPEPSEKAKLAFDKQQNNAIAPVFKGISLKHDSQLYWLEIDSSIDKVWSSLPAFLASEGIAIERVEKLQGFIDTQWMNEYQITYAEATQTSSWFKGFSPDYKDKFRLRVEAVEGEDKTRLYVSHRGMQIVVKNEATQWEQRASETLLEREIMYRYALYSGASVSNATDLLAGYQSYQPRVSLNKDNPDEFNVQGDRATVWLRLKIAIDRLGAEIIKVDEQAGKIEILVGAITEASSELNQEGSWFGGFFGRDIVVDDEDDGYRATEPAKPEVEAKSDVAAKDRIKLSVQQIASEYSSTIKLRNGDGSKTESAIALEFRNALVKQLR